MYKRPLMSVGRYAGSATRTTSLAGLAVCVLREVGAVGSRAKRLFRGCEIRKLLGSVAAMLARRFRLVAHRGANDQLGALPALLSGSARQRFAVDARGDAWDSRCKGYAIPPRVSRSRAGRDRATRRIPARLPPPLSLSSMRVSLGRAWVGVLIDVDGSPDRYGCCRAWRARASALVRRCLR